MWFGGVRARIALAGFCAVVMLFLTWCSDRSAYTVGNEDVLMRHIYVASKLFGIPDRKLPSRFLAVNVGYDRQLAPLCDSTMAYIGERDIANRYRMHDFLEAIKGLDYKAVLLDVFFDGDNPAPGDTALIELINSMERVVVPDDKSRRISPLLDRSKIVDGDYIVNVYEDDFVKYIFECGDDGSSLALRTYELALGDSTARKSVFSQPAIILPLNITMREQLNADGTQNWYNLGTDLLNPDEVDVLPLRVKDRIVVIGDFVKRDRHGTYVGEISGSVIHINAIEALDRGLNRISFVEALLMGLSYFAICLVLILGSKIWRRFRVRPGSLLEYLLNFISFSVYLVIIEIILYLCFGKFHDTFLVAVFLSLFTLFCQQLNKQKSL